MDFVRGRWTKPPPDRRDGMEGVGLLPCLAPAPTPTPGHLNGAALLHAGEGGVLGHRKREGVLAHGGVAEGRQGRGGGSGGKHNCLHMGLPYGSPPVRRGNTREDWQATKRFGLVVACP